MAVRPIVAFLGLSSFAKALLLPGLVLVLIAAAAYSDVRRHPTATRPAVLRGVGRQGRPARSYPRKTLVVMRERSGRKFISHAAGRLRVADVYGAAGGRENMRRSALGRARSVATQ